jgi:hypothetical protein
MGLYDNLKCEYPLPDKTVQEDTFQTKSFYRALENYLITTDGRLIHESRMWGKVEVPFDGEFSFHTSKDSHQNGDFEWFEFRAVFKQGVLQEITRITQTI